MWNDSTRTTQLTKRTEEATQQQEIFDKANQKVKELGGTPLTQPGKIVDNQTLWNKVTSWTSKLTGQPNQNPQQPTGGTGNPANTIPTQPQQAAGSTAAPTTQQQQPTGGTGFTLSQPSTWFGGWSIFGSGQNNQPSATPTQGTLSPSSSPTQHTSSPIAQSSPASGSAVSKSTKKVTPPKASGLIDRWFDSKPKTRSERTRSVQEKHKSQEHQKNRFTASKTHKNNNITQEWDETKKKGKEEISAVISDANSALSK